MSEQEKGAESGPEAIGARAEPAAVSLGLALADKKDEARKHFAQAAALDPSEKSELASVDV